MSSDGIALIYGACLLLGLVYSAMQFVFGAHHGVDSGGHGVDVGHHGWDLGHVGHHPLGPIHHAAGDLGHGADSGHAGHSALEDGAAPQTVSFLNPLTIGTWVTTFGGFGLIFLAALHSVPLSLAASGASSLLATLLAFYIFLHFLIQPEFVRNMTPEETVGMRAEVAVSIPEGPGGMGRITYVLDAKRFVMNARSQDSVAIPKGAAVRVASVSAQTATVRPLDEPVRDAAPPPTEDLQDTAA
jgi:hypothetical protein